MSLLRRALPVLVVPAVFLAVGGSAWGEPGPIRLLSKSGLEQADFARSTAISGNGGYVAFVATIGRLRGVFRENLSSGEIVAVAAGDPYTRVGPIDASAPSISADGRYVSFTTKAPMEPVADGAGPEDSDVYVADMEGPSPSYELASARDNVAAGLTYGGSAGSIASGRVALSGDGREVVFVTRASSNLTGAAGATETPAGQVAVRYLDSDRTTLVSEARDPVSRAMETGVPVPGGSMMSTASFVGASLSADGTTVAWLGAHLPAQVPLLSDETSAIQQNDNGGQVPYDEPLWRRIADGPTAPTRRIIGGGDPLASGCPSGGTLANPACAGPFPGLINKDNPAEVSTGSGWLGFPTIDGVPQLSADGRTVALIGNPNESVLTSGRSIESLATNIFVVDMGAGLSRLQAVQRLTREVIVDSDNPQATINVPGFIPLNGHITDLAISADGNRIAFTTARQFFPLSPPNLIGSPPSSLGLVEVYLLDRQRQTIQRLTHGDDSDAEPSLSQAIGQGASNGAGASSPSLDADGGRIAFSSIASNLVPGDGNDESDGFLVEDPLRTTTPGVSSIAPLGVSSVGKPPWRLVLHGASLPDGSVRLSADLPAAGVLRGQTAASMSVGSRPRRLAAGRTVALGSGTAMLRFELPAGLRRLARAPGGLYAIAAVSFSSPAGKTLRGRLQVRFHVHRARHRKGNR